MFNITTVQEIYNLNHKLEKLETTLFKTGIDVNNELNEVLSNDEKRDFTQFCKEKNLNIDNKKDLQTAIESLKKYLADLKVINVYLAIKPTINMVNRIKEKIDNNKNNFVLNIFVRPSITGGAIFEYKGLYKDYSIKKIKELQE